MMNIYHRCIFIYVCTALGLLSLSLSLFLWLRLNVIDVISMNLRLDDSKDWNINLNYCCWFYHNDSSLLIRTITTF